MSATDSSGVKGGEADSRLSGMACMNVARTGCRGHDEEWHERISIRKHLPVHLYIRDKLGSVKDNTGDVEKLASEAAEILKKARSETTAMINEKKSAKQSELDAMYNAAKGKVTAEVDAAIAVLDKESATVLKNLDAQV